MKYIYIIIAITLLYFVGNDIYKQNTKQQEEEKVPVLPAIRPVKSLKEFMMIHCSKRRRNQFVQESMNLLPALKKLNTWIHKCFSMFT